MIYAIWVDTLWADRPRRVQKPNIPKRRLHMDPGYPLYSQQPPVHDLETSRRSENEGFERLGFQDQSR